MKVIVIPEKGFGILWRSNPKGAFMKKKKWGGVRKGAGRPFKPARARRSETTWITWTPAEHRQIVEASKAESRDLMEWQREVLLRAAEKAKK